LLEKPQKNLVGFAWGAQMLLMATIAERSDQRCGRWTCPLCGRKPIADLLAGDPDISGALEAAEHLRDSILECDVDTEATAGELLDPSGRFARNRVRLLNIAKGRDQFTGGK
jgi:hypothetical protein